MDIAINLFEDWIQLTSVQMARNRRDDYGRDGYSGVLRRQRSDEGGYGGSHPGQPRWKLLFITLIIVLLGLGLLVGIGSCVSSLNTRLQKYMPLTETAEVVELTILKTREGEDQLSILLTLIGANSFSKTDKTPHLIQGNKVILQYEYLLVPSQLGFLGLHSGYILISLDVQNRNGTIVSSRRLNAADNDNSFPTQLYAFLISPRYGSITLLPSRSVYKICITPSGLLQEC